MSRDLDYCVHMAGVSFSTYGVIDHATDDRIL